MRLRPLGMAVAVVALATACSGTGSTAPTIDTTARPAVATTEAPTTTLPPACDVPASPAQSFTAQVVPTVTQIPVYEAPGGAEVRTMENPRLINGDPNAAVPTVFLVKDAPPAEDCAWVEVYLPVRPNGSTGWVRRTDVAIVPNPYRLVADIGDFTLTLYRAGEQVKVIDIAVASDNTPTPGGLYYITELVRTPNPGGAYGPYAYGLSGFSDVHQTFNGGPGQLGIHGTNQPQLIGQKVSNGCIRMHNDDITDLAEVLPLGVPVEVTT
jgi:lipoprotein-anchoring transpeptidase ErfK/SrfK